MSDDKLLQKLSQNSPKLTPDNKPNDKKKPHEEANDNPIKESSKMAPQYKNKDDSKKNNNHTDNSWEETIVNGFQLDSALPEDGKSHRGLLRFQRKTKHKNKQYNRELIQEENREKASDKKNRYESFCEEWGWDDSI
ncbi:hypothetical protein RhiirA5_367518 [Rhizophagus irregularis]|uniref:Uncharacterized protein n=3 Tax=Rhizophagus irregularis TaxID=588596 RepID=A0A2N0NRK4_9GLOM|nr:hypothetical protein RirG_173880 [Rhizophagus irregularis DAOM 197198w]PKB97207.1 hypothetical protein RhiirA5_367518 [Rhizophagus irregularis]UZO24790.1 hypothetical protein OCT59_017084 [Rhizophagus irregularis]GBC14769.1 hypothetical protein GLOIN_2v1840059 [Rhizophagus irregularis DAOM 181602=DAOM 197198]